MRTGYLSKSDDWIKFVYLATLWSAHYELYGLGHSSLWFLWIFGGSSIAGAILCLGRAACDLATWTRGPV